MMETVPIGTTITEQEKVHFFRFEQMINHGIKVTTAETLARGTCDLHAVLDAKVRGCSDRLLREIYADD